MPSLAGKFALEQSNGTRVRARLCLAYAIYYEVDDLTVLEEFRMQPMLGPFIEKVLKFISRREELAQTTGALV